MGTVVSGSGNNAVATVDTTPLALREIMYDPDGYPIIIADKVDVGATRSVYPMAIGGRDFRTIVANRSRIDGSQPVSNDTPLFWDPREGAALNTNLWTSTLTTWTVPSVTSGVLLFNPAAVTTINTGGLLSSIPRIPRYSGVPIIGRFRVKPGAHATGSTHDIGFGLPSTAIAAVAGDGAYWSKSQSGQWTANLIVNGVPITDSDPIDDATFVLTTPNTDYAEFVIVIYDDRAEFFIESVAGAQLARRTVMFSQAAGTAGFASDHLYVMLRSWNQAAPATAVSMAVAGVKVDQLDMPSGHPWIELAAMNGYQAVSSPTVFTQTPNYTNNAAPTTRTPTNTTALEPTLGGHVSWNNAGTSFAGSDTADWVLFGYQAPTPFGLLIKNVRIDTVNLGAANAAAPYTIEYGLAVNSNAVSLATGSPNGPRFIPLGVMTLAASAAIGVPFTSAIQMPITLYLEPGKFLHLVGRVLAGTATASQVIRTVFAVDAVWR